MDSAIVPAIVAAGVIAVVLLLGWIPGHIARSRGHINADAINLAGWLGLVFGAGLIWLIALIWAHTGPDNSKRAGGRVRQRNRYASRANVAAIDALEEMERQ